MSTRSKIRALVARELDRLQNQPALSADDMDLLLQLAKTAAVAEGLPADERSEPEADSEALEKALRG